MNQGQLQFDGCHHPSALARTTDPITSHDAAARTTPKLNGLEQRVLDVLRTAAKVDPLKGLTSAEISHETGIARVSISPRLKPLEDKDFVKRSEHRRNGGIVWEAVPQSS